MDITLKQARHLFDIDNCEDEFKKLSRSGDLNYQTIHANYRQCLKLKKQKSCQFYSFFAMKGGVGKTTLSQHFAKYLAYQGLKTLIIPLDFTKSMTKLFLSAGTARKNDSIFQLLVNIAEDNNIRIASTGIPGLYLVPEKSDIVMEFPFVLEKINDSRDYDGLKAVNDQNVFSEVLCPCLESQFDAIVFDLPPTSNPLSINALRASDSVIIPSTPDFKDMSTAGPSKDFVLKNNASAKISFVINKWNDSAQNRDMSEFLTENHKENTTYLVPYNRTIISKADFDNTDVFCSSPSSNFSASLGEIFCDIWKKSRRK